jgi:hypothetical protein
MTDKKRQRAYASKDDSGLESAAITFNPLRAKRAEKLLAMLSD